MKVASYALSSSAIIFFFLIVVADLKGLFTNKCMMYTNVAPFAFACVEILPDMECFLNLLDLF